MVMEYSSWWPASSWISPGAALFLCATCSSAPLWSRRLEETRPAAASTWRLCRSASSMVLGRIRSFSMFSVHHVPVEEDGYAPYMELEAEVQQPQPATAEPAMIPTATASAATAAASSESAKEVAEVGKKDERIGSDEIQGRPVEGHAQQPPSSSSPVATSAASAEATAAAERPATVVGSIVQRARACRWEFVEEVLEGKAALNARAELFIQQFREDLKLQRLNSIINYTRALRRGAGGAEPATGE